jgi:hypothetical protein
MYKSSLFEILKKAITVLTRLVNHDAGKKGEVL